MSAPRPIDPEDTMRRTLNSQLKPIHDAEVNKRYEKRLEKRGQFRARIDLYHKCCQNILVPEFYYTRMAGYLLTFTTPVIIGYYCKFNRGRYLRPVLLIASTSGLFANFHFQ